MLRITMVIVLWNYMTEAFHSDLNEPFLLHECQYTSGSLCATQTWWGGQVISSPSPFSKIYTLVSAMRSQPG